MKLNWIKKADDAAPPLQSLDEVDKDRKPAPVQPTALPEAPEPVAMNELLKAFEQAAKELMTAGLGIHKATVAMQKVTSSGGRTPAEMSLISKAESLISQIEDLRGRTEKLAHTVSSERTKLLGADDASDQTSAKNRSPWTR